MVMPLDVAQIGWQNWLLGVCFSNALIQFIYIFKIIYHNILFVAKRPLCCLDLRAQSFVSFLLVTLSRKGRGHYHSYKPIRVIKGVISFTFYANCLSK
jgi:hypothetical protein